jgi:hypothetical protein
VKLIRFGRFIPIVALAWFISAAAPATAWAQTVSNSDIQRLQDSIYEVSSEVSQLRAHDATLASQLQSDLDDLRDEAVYLKVKLRHNEPVSRSEYNDVRDRIDSLRDRARGDSSGRYNTPSSSSRPVPSEPRTGEDRAPYGSVRTSNPNEVPVDTEFDVRLQDSLSSATAKPEDRFEATTAVDLRDDRGRLLVPAGSTMRGVINSVQKATRTERTGKLTVAFDRLTIDGRSYPIRATVTQALESEGIRGEMGKIGIGAGAGAVIGAILGGAKGALAGILIGGGGTIAATEGKDVELPAGTLLRVRLDAPIDLQR